MVQRAADDKIRGGHRCTVDRAGKRAGSQHIDGANPYGIGRAIAQPGDHQRACGPCGHKRLVVVSPIDGVFVVDNGVSAVEGWRCEAHTELAVPAGDGDDRRRAR